MAHLAPFPTPVARVDTATRHPHHLVKNIQGRTGSTAGACVSAYLHGSTRKRRTYPSAVW
jgi:hypothetical protein